MAGRGDRMVQETVQPLADSEQLELMQQLGRIGYWEYDPANDSFMLPPPSLHLLASMLGTSSHCAPLLRDCVRCRAPPFPQRPRTGREPAAQPEPRTAADEPAWRPCNDSRQGRPIEQDGKLRFAGTFRDITSEKSVESEREAVLSQLHAVIGSLPVGVTVFDGTCACSSGTITSTTFSACRGGSP